jgi:L-lysine 2,3-aminomutase
MTHFVHPNELTNIAIDTCHQIQKTGVRMTNQLPLLRGINDKPEILSELFSKLSFYGVIPYYVFQCRPASGNKTFTVPIEEGYNIIERAKSKVSGLAKRARYVMSHSTGKIEIIGKTAENTFMKYHRAANDADSGKFMILKSNPKACWFDDYEEISSDYPLNEPYRTYGPE